MTTPDSTPAERTPQSTPDSPPDSPPDVGDGTTDTPAADARTAGPPRESTAADGGPAAPADAPRPRPRILLVTGPSGDGATTVAAATALAAARRGQQTLLLSAESPAQLAALLGEAPPAWPDEPAGRGPIQAARLDSARSFRAAVLALQRRVRPALDAVGAAPLDDDELTELPGSAALALYEALRDAHAAGRWDLVVLDAGPVTEALRLLALPEQLGRYLRRLLPPERLTARALRPLLARLAGVPLPAPAVFEAGARWDGVLAAVREVVAGPDVAVRLVLDPQTSRSTGVARAARAGFALHGIALEAVIANRMIPLTPGIDPWLAALAERQGETLTAFADAVRVPEARLHHLPHLGREAGPAQLRHLAATVAPPAPRPHRDEPTLHDRLADDGILVWRLPVPGAVREELDLVRRGDELIVTTGPFRRLLPLPAALRRCAVSGAALESDGMLAVRFRPDPNLWPSGRATATA